MASLNRVTLIGNLTRDPEHRAAGASTVCNFSLATNERWQDRDGNWQERAEFHRIACFGKLADACSKSLSKGRQVYVEGKLQTRKWTDKDGGERQSTEVVAETVLFLGDRGERSERPSLPPVDHKPTNIDTRPRGRRSDPSWMQQEDQL